MSVVEAVQRDVDSLGGGLEKSGLAAVALSLAAQMDDLENSATSKSMCAKALLETMDRLRVLAPPKKENDDVDEVAAKRSARQAAARIAGA